MNTWFIILVLTFLVLCDESVQFTEITYPKTDKDEQCFTTVGGIEQKGICKNIINCPKALDLLQNEGIHPQTCFFDKFDHIVCCPNVSTSVTYESTTTKSPDSKILTTNKTTSCTFRDDDSKSINGNCITFPECVSAINLWKTERVLYHLDCRKATTVCCTDNENDPNIKSSKLLRLSEKECNAFYGPFPRNEPLGIGYPAQAKEFPYMCALGWNSTFGDSISYNCGGVLISERFVLTAAHCVSLRGEEPIVVRIGGENLTDSSVDEIYIERIIVHPNYDPNSNHDDIALIELESEITEIYPACLWSDNILEQNNLTALGYGNTRFAGPSSDQLIKVALNLVSNTLCGLHYDLDLLGSQMCAGNLKQRMDTCQGDSGGPLLMYKESKDYPYVVGIVSFGNPCGGASPGVYTRTSSYIDWIEKVVWE